MGVFCFIGSFWLFGVHFSGVDGVKIVSLAVPAVVAEGSGAVNLDCVYQVADHERQGLVVQWFLRDLLVYQWIPGKQPQDNGPLKGEPPHKPSTQKRTASNQSASTHPPP